jgi:undecaprenyl-diphosphatase
MDSELLKAIVLGLVQGLSEFLPISSSGHLVIFQELLDFHKEGIAFEVFVHFGTLLSVLTAFRKEISQLILAPFKIWFAGSHNPEDKENLRWGYYILLATIPAGAVGLTLKDHIEKVFSDVLLVYCFLMITGILMWFTQYLKPKTGVRFNFRNTFIMGIAQAFAILPGISRSGSTIFAAMAQGIKKEKAAKFSFIMSIPPIFGAALLQIKKMAAAPPPTSELIYLLAALLAAFISGYLAILWLLDLVRKGRLKIFGIYCVIISALGMIIYFG